MNNNRKSMLVFGTMLTLTFGILLSTTTTLQVELSAQNMTGGENNMTSGNMTDAEQSGGGVAGIAINEKGKPAEGKGR